MIALLALALAACTVTDGDTIRCGDERIRLLAIDAPELPGHCARGRNCAEGDPFASRSALQAAMQGRELTIDRAGIDRYGRTLGVVYAAGVNLSCLQVENGHAVYQRRYDNGGRVRADCPTVAE
jgi:endonuclease YncB( thermonuclease family)